MRRRLLVSFLAAVVLAVGLSACGGGSSERLTIYSGRQQELIGPLLDEFSQQTGIGVDVRYGDSADLALLIDEEGDQSPADVFLSQSPGAMGFLDSKERLRRVGDDVLDLVPARFHADDGRWVGISGRVRVLVYNTDLVKRSDLPTSVFDLTRSEYRDQVAVAPSNASFQDFVTAMRELVGDRRTKDWLDGMKTNGARAYANNIAIVDAVGRGEIPMGLVNNYYLEEAQAQNAGIPAANYLFPNADVGSLILTTTAGVLDTANDQTMAERLLSFLLSKKAQRFYANETFEYPLAHGVQPVGDKPPLDEIQSPTLDLSSLGGGLERTRRLIADSGLERA